MKEKYNKAFEETFGLLSEEVNESLDMKNTEDWDSVGHIRLVTAIEDSFDIMFEMEDILGFTSYENGKQILKKYGIEI